MKPTKPITFKPYEAGPSSYWKEVWKKYRRHRCTHDPKTISTVNALSTWHVCKECGASDTMITTPIDGTTLVRNLLGVNVPISHPNTAAKKQWALPFWIKFCGVLLAVGIGIAIAWTIIWMLMGSFSQVLTIAHKNNISLIPWLPLLIFGAVATIFKFRLERVLITGICCLALWAFLDIISR